MPKGLLPNASFILPNLKPRIKGSFFYFLLFLAALPVFLIPLRNPDLFWGFSSARWILLHRAFPHADFLSWTKPQTPWIDFEWLSHLLFLSLYRIGGWKTLLFLKASLLFLAWVPIGFFLNERRIEKNLIVGAFLLWAASSISHSDLRPELFSLIFFAGLMVSLENNRENKKNSSLRGNGVFFGLFALWANLHAGFIFGEALIFFYAACHLTSKEISRFKKTVLWGISAFLGSLINPYGLGPYQVALAHLKQESALSQSIMEWRPFNFSPPIHWPTDIAFVLLFLAVTILLIHKPFRTKLKIFFPTISLTLALSLSTLEHRRMAPYFIIAFLMAGGTWIQETGFQKKYASTGSFMLSLGSIFFIWSFWPPSIQNLPFDGRLLPEKAAVFIAQKGPALSNLRFYNPWEWGGYLGWKLRPWFKPYCDGRYIFHDLLFPQKRAVLNSNNWQEFLDSQKINAALIPYLNQPDSWIFNFMPKKKWTLLYRDQTALLFVRKTTLQGRGL